MLAWRWNGLRQGRPIYLTNQSVQWDLKVSGVFITASEINWRIALTAVFTYTVHDDLVDSTDDIPPACKSACPDSFINSSSNCTASRRTELRSCQCTKESHLLDQWTKCDACLEVEWVTPGEIYQSFKPNCTGFRSLGERSFFFTSKRIQVKNN